MHYSNEADIAFYVNLALRDSTKICNAVLSSTKAANYEGITSPIKLKVWQEMSIFSNRCDHAAVLQTHQFSAWKRKSILISTLMMNQKIGHLVNYLTSSMICAVVGNPAQLVLLLVSIW